MNFPFFVSKRFIFSKKESSFITFISSISIFGIAIGVATLIIALSILAGFEKTITETIIDFDSHIQITSYTNTLPGVEENLSTIKTLLPADAGISSYISNLAIISSRRVQEGINVKGILPESEALRIRDNVTDGEFDLTGNGIIIGRKLANKLLVNVNDRVTVFALNENELPSAANPPNIMQFQITAIFESGMAEYDDLFCYVNLETAQQLFGMENEINGFDIKLNDISKIDSLSNLLSQNLRYPYVVRSIFQIHRNIFTWIELQKAPIPVILGLIIIVAVFNIIGTLLMIVLEKTNAIGTLKSIGARNKHIIQIFLLQGVFLAIIGIIIGNLIAYTLIQLQVQYQFISIPSSVYFMSTVPFDLTWKIFAGVSVLTFLLCLFVSVIPSYIASKINPVSSLRFG
jgi:lipoprotein-releasing system permease protein